MQNDHSQDELHPIRPLNIAQRELGPKDAFIGSETTTTTLLIAIVSSDANKTWWAPPTHLQKNPYAALSQVI